MSRSHLLALFFGILTFLGALTGTARWAYQQGFAEKAEEAGTKLALYKAYLQGVLEKYEFLPELLTHDKRLVSYLLNPGGRERIVALNRYLETVNNISDAADTYLMDREGLTIAASNWQTPRPFVGRNFSFRPYFKEAMQGQLGRYFALGTTSVQRGYYFAYPVRHKKNILGALVMKINIDSVEDSWKKQGDTFLVTDPEGVIFITTDPSWRYRTLYPLSRDIQEQIIESKRYPEATLRPLSVAHVKEVGKFKLYSVLNEDTGVIGHYLHLSTLMTEAGWEVQILSDIKGVEQFVVRTLIGVGSVFVIIGMLILLFWQHRQRLIERHRYEERSRKMLENANEVLELRVSDRTVELTESNKKLRQEIVERQKTEQALRRARKELIHAAKLAALGQMSAGITHELNQPLAAIRTYSDNAVQLLEHNRSDDALWNLEQISELTERMAQLSTQLKLFARKTSDKVTAVPLHGCLDGALEILRPVIRKSDVSLDVRIIPDDLEVMANSVLLQQVFINLLSNGMHAVGTRDNGRIQVLAESGNGMVEVVVEDNGPGVEEADSDKIFEPFYTTKEPGQGLGLGLTITSRIVREMGGTISLEKREAGACFKILLQAP